jgi:hypothetical protein
MSDSLQLFDLNINNYKISELEKILSLDDNYKLDDVNKNKQQIKDKILAEKTIPIETKEKIISFIDTASNTIFNNKFKINFELTIKNNKFQQLSEETSEINLQNKLIDNTSGNNNFIIRHPSINEGIRSKTWNGRSMDDNKNMPGYLNPINVRSLKRTINIDSRFRQNYYNTMSTNFNVQLPVSVKKAVSMRLTSLEIPITFYVVSKHNDNYYFKIEWDPDIFGIYQKSGVVMIGDGNYEPFWQDTTSAVDLAYTINRMLHALDPDDTKLNNIVYNIDRVSGKSCFGWKFFETSTTENFKVTFGVDSNGNSDIITNLQLKLGWLLGFRTSSYEGKSIISEGVCYMKGPRYAFLSIKDFQNSSSNYFISAFSSSLLQDDILARINLGFIQQSQGIYQSGQDDGFSTQINRQRNYFGPVDIEKLEIKLIDEYGRIIDLNNMDWSFALTMECLYD